MPTFRAADGTGLFYADQGQGPAVICLPGLTRNGADFGFVAPHLTGLRLIRPDYRGRGRSDWADPATYTVPHESADVLALMDHLDLPRAAILGTSRGGLIAMALAATAKDRLSAVALNDIGPEIAPEGLAYIAQYIGRNPPQTSLAEAAAARARAMAGFEGVPPARWLAEAQALFEERPEGLVNRYDPALREAMLAGLAQPQPDLWPLFDALAGLPLALIHAVNSNLLTAATVAEMARRRPDMILAEVPGRAHVPFLDEPEALAALNRWKGQLR